MRRRRLLQGLVQGIGTAAATAPFLAGCEAETVTAGPPVQTTAGAVQGQRVGGIHRFRGIPYAEPPFGENRFLKPVRRQRWSGVRSATSYGAICPQTGGGGVDLGADEGEDCLNLNVWTPDLGATNLPVMVWAHGGGQVTGSGSAPIYDGSHFARDGVVLVTCNRRLGAEGFLYLEEAFGEGVGPGNLGIEDLIAVLRWVQENIAQFGGDPGNVTLFGESGGAAATQAVVATRGSEGLVHRVIVQSGGHAAQRPDTAALVARHALERLGIRAGDLGALRSRPWGDFVALYDELETLGLGHPQVYLPMLGPAMPDHPVDAVEAGRGRDIDYLIGTCRDEAKLFAFLMDLKGSVFDQRANRVLEAAGVSFEALSAAYAESRPELDAEGLFHAIVGDLWFRVPSVRIADSHARHGPGRTWVYRFDWETQLLGAAHAVDLIVFGNGVPLGIALGFADPDEVSRRMRRAWVNFARTGDPSTPEFQWPPYQTPEYSTVSLDTSFSVLTNAYAGQRQLLGPVLSQSWSTLGL